MRRLIYRDAAPEADILGAVGRIKDWTRAALGLPPGVALSVTELACAAEGCPPRETVILVMPPGDRARKYSVHKAIPDVTEADIAACALRHPVML
jgi:hypothetical protein